MFFVYILQSDTTFRFYTASTEDLANRIEEHNAGENKSTRNGIPWQLVHQEQFATSSDALRKEIQIKNRGAERYMRGLLSEPPG